MSNPYRERGERLEALGARWGATRWVRVAVRMERALARLVDGEEARRARRRDERRFAADARAYRLKMAAWRDETGLKLLEVEALVAQLEDDEECYPLGPHLPRLPDPPALPVLKVRG